MNEQKINNWFSELSYVDKLSLFEGREKLGLMDEEGWICDECNKEMKNSDEGIAYDDVAYCSQECIDERKAQE